MAIWAPKVTSRRSILHDPALDSLRLGNSTGSAADCNRRGSTLDCYCPTPIYPASSRYIRSIPLQYPARNFSRHSTAALISA